MELNTVIDVTGNDHCQRDLTKRFDITIIDFTAIESQPSMLPSLVVYSTVDLENRLPPRYSRVVPWPVSVPNLIQFGLSVDY